MRPAPGEHLTSAAAPVTLAAHGYEATVSPLGAALQRLVHRGRDLVYRVAAEVPTPQYCGVVLAPWPNRIADGRYRFGGSEHQLPINEVERGTALHGLALWEAWQLVVDDGRAATFEHTLWPRPGYPFRLTVRATYSLGADGLILDLAATNTGGVPAPVGLSAHPYLTTGDGSRLDDWTLRLPCGEVVLTDERLLPLRTVPVDGTDLDLREPGLIGARSIDHAFTAVVAPDGNAAATLLGPTGAGVEVWWDAASGWVQVYTLDVPGDPMHRRAVAIEPMTCAPDAFNNGDGLAVLAPGETLTTTMGIAAV